MTLFDLAVVLIAIAIGTWGGFAVLSVSGRIWSWLKDVKNPVSFFNRLGFTVFWWQIRLDHARSYRSRHAGVMS